MTIEKREKVKCVNEFFLDVRKGVVSEEGEGVKVYKNEIFSLNVIDFEKINILSNKRITFYFKGRDIKILFEGVDI